MENSKAGPLSAPVPPTNRNAVLEEAIAVDIGRPVGANNPMYETGFAAGWYQARDWYRSRIAALKTQDLAKSSPPAPVPPMKKTGEQILAMFAESGMVTFTQQQKVVVLAAMAQYLHVHGPKPSPPARASEEDGFGLWYVQGGAEKLQGIYDSHYEPDDCTDSQLAIQEIAEVVWQAARHAPAESSQPPTLTKFRKLEQDIQEKIAFYSRNREEECEPPACLELGWVLSDLREALAEPSPKSEGWIDVKERKL